MLRQQPQPKLWTKSFIFLILANLFTFMSFQMTIPILPPRVQDLGGVGIEIGLVTTLFSVSAILCRPFIGFILLSQTRKKLAIGGSLALLLTTAAYPLLHVVTILLLFRFIHGAAWGWSSTTNGTSASDLVPRSRVGEGMGYFGLSVTVGMILAPSLGIYVYENYSFHSAIIISAVLGACALVLFSFTSFHTPKKVRETAFSFRDFTFFGSLFEKSSAFPTLVAFLSTFAYGSIVAFIVIFAHEQGLDKVYLFYLFNAVFATATRPLAGRWFDRQGPWGILIPCSLFACIGMWVLSLATNNLYFVTSGILFGIGYGSMMPTFQAWMISRAAPEKSGIANGMFYSCIDAGIGLSGIIMGTLAGFVPTFALFQISSFSFLAVTVLSFADFKRRRKYRSASQH